MGGLAEAEVGDAIRSIAARDVSLASSVIVRDAKLDGLEMDIERKAVKLIALRQPVADESPANGGGHEDQQQPRALRNLAKNIAKRAIVIAESEPGHAAHEFDRGMGELVNGAAKIVLEGPDIREVEPAITV